MTQQISPFVETKYGWNFGESGWNSGMDENLVKLGFLFDGNVNSIVGSLPAAVNGEAYFLTTDNRFYFAVGTTFYSSPCPKSFVFKIKSTGDFYQFNGISAVQVDNPSQIGGRLSSVESTVASLGTAAFEDVSSFATQANLDVVEAQANQYTDDLRSDILDGAQGASIVGISVPGGQTKTIADRLYSEINVFDFMTTAQVQDALSDSPTLDHTAAIQAFFNELQLNNYDKVIFSGNFRVTSKLTLSAPKSAVLNFNCKLVSDYTSEEEMLLIDNYQYGRIIGRIELVGKGTYTYSTRTNGSGLKINNSFRLKIDEVRCSYFKYDGVNIVNGADVGGGNSNLWSISKLICDGIGGGKIGSAQSVPRSVTSISTTGTASSFTQRTILGFSALPTGLRQHDLVVAGGALHSIDSVDYGANTVTVFPFTPGSVGIGSSVTFYCGAALYVQGGDAGVGYIEQMDIKNSGVAYNALNLYPASVGSLTVQNCSLAVRLGRATTGAAEGGVINHIYCETNDFDFLRATAFLDIGFKILNSGTIQMSKCVALSPLDGSNVPLPAYSALFGVQISNEVAEFQPRPTLVSSTRTLTMNPKPGVVETLRANTATVTLSGDNDNNRLWNASDAMLFIAGTGNNSAPSGTITFTPPAGGTINGGAVDASLAFSGFSGPCNFYIRKEINNYVVQRCDQQTILNASATYDWPSLAAGAQQSTTVSVTGAAVGDFVNVSFGASLQGTRLWGEVTSSNTVTVYQSNGTAAPVDLASGNIFVRVVKR